MKTIITIQHTQSVHHLNGMVGSWTDWDLSDLGRQQADCIGARLAKELDGKPCVMYTSDLKRASQTAEIVGHHLNINPIQEFALRERNLGKCVGRTVQWLRENMECQEKTIDDRMFSEAESRRDEWQRLLPFFERLLHSEDETILLVSHGDLLSVFNAMWLGLPAETLNTGEMFGLAGGVSWMVRQDGGKRMIRRLSDMSYIQEPAKGDHP